MSEIDFNLSRPSYEDLNIDSDVSGYDTIELKYDGIWGQFYAEEGRFSIWSRNGKKKKEGILKTKVDHPLLLHGEFMFGSNWSQETGLSGKFFVFDAIKAGGKNWSSQPLSVRRKIAMNAVDLIGQPLTLVKSYPITDLKCIWHKHVALEGWEGVILKHTTQPFGKGWARIKAQFDVDYVCVGFNHSDAEKYKGKMVRSIKAGVYVDGELKHVCNVSGMNEGERRKMYDSPELFLGKVFTAQGKRVHFNGSLRHPNFFRWHLDKKDTDCTLDSVLRVRGRTKLNE